MSLHDLLDRHVANLKDSHWGAGHFVTHCTKCGREMIKQPGLSSRLAPVSV
jgi:hypothetical protein